ncbi:hypothetical protein [Shewanella mangrovisoli]|uniref:hypothetical protein n=1 Tax=Shewanella mangrovisoli TaxID=2864211 RepID=UPI0035B75547
MTKNNLIVAYYLKIDQTYWAIMVDGTWLPVTAEDLLEGIQVIDVNTDDIQFNDGERPYLIINGAKLSIPENLSNGHPDTPDKNTESHNNNHSDQSHQTQGRNYFYQIVANYHNDLIAESGFSTQGDELSLTSRADEFADNHGDSFVPIILTVNIDDGKDGYINLAETPMVDLSGEALNARDGQVLVLLLTDVQGNQLRFEVVVINKQWQLNDVDISSLIDGPIVAVISAPSYQGDVTPGLDESIKDTIASISIEIVDNDGVINANEQTQVVIRGSVTNVEDGQIVTVMLTDEHGQTRQITTTVIGGLWQLTAQDLQGFADGMLNATATVSDLAGNGASASTSEAVDIIADINVEVDTGRDEFLNRFEVPKTDISGTIDDVEDGQSVNIRVTDSQGNSLSFSSVIVDGSWSLLDADLSSLQDGTLTITASTVDLAGNPARSTITIIKDTKATISIEAVDNNGVLNNAESGHTLLQGDATNIEEGRPVLVAVLDEAGNRLVFLTRVVDGQWQLADKDLSSLQDGVLRLFALTIDAEGNPTFSRNTILKDTQASITVELIDNDGVVNAHEQTHVVVQGTVTNVEDGQTVTVMLTDGQGNSRALTTIVVNGTWSLTAQDLSGFTDGNLMATASVTDVAGNSASANDTIAVDILASIAIDVDTGRDNFINRFEMKRVDIQGNVTDVENGQTVTVTVTDAHGFSLTFTTLVVNGQWALDNLDLSQMVDGNLTFVASSIDTAGNPTSTTTLVPKDTQAGVTIEAVDNDGVLNSAESSGVILRGEAVNIEDGLPVRVIITDVNGNSLSFTAFVLDGQWQLDNLDLSTLVDGNLSLRAITADAENNPATATNTILKDTQADISVEIVDNDGVINAVEMSQVVARGTVANVEDGQTVTVLFTDGFGHSLQVQAIVSGGAWTIAPQDLSAFDDGTLTATASVSDVAGNLATNSSATPVDIVAALTIGIDTGRDDIINRFEMKRLDISGVVDDVENGQSVTVTLTDSDGNSLSYTTQVVNGRWQLDNLDISILVDGQLTATAQTIDLAGNPASATITVIKDTQAAVTISAVDSDQVLNGVESGTAVLAGEALNIEDGQTVVITVTDANGKMLTFSSTVNDGYWVLTGANLSSLIDGTLSLRALAIDIEGNPSTSTNTVLKDTQAQITVDIIDTDGVLNLVEMAAVISQGTVSNVEEGQTVTVVFTDGNGHSRQVQAVVHSGMWVTQAVDLSDFDSTSLTATAQVSDLAGNPATAVSAIPVDTLASITVNILDNDGVINAAEQTSVRIQGTVTNVENGQTVTVVLTDGQGHSRTVTTTVVNGIWILTAQDLSGFEDGSLSATASVVDLAGNPATANTSNAVDILASIDLSVDTGRDNTINRFEMHHTDISGTVGDVENGQSVTVTVTDANNMSLTFNTKVVNGTWLISAADLSSLIDGKLTVIASTVDVAGNPTSSSTNVIKDTSSLVTIAAIDADQVLNAAESGMATLAGEAVNIEDGLPVIVRVTDANGTSLTFTARVVDGQWRIDNADLSSLLDGTLTLAVVTTDAEGNPAAAYNRVQKDTQASVTIEILDNDGVINAREQTAVQVRGTVSNIEDGRVVTVLLSDGQGHTRTVTTTVVNGAWALTAQDLTGFNDGSLTATATVSDTSGNPATATTTELVDILATISIEVDTGRDDIINRFEARQSDFSGAVNDVENGQNVIITVTDANGTRLIFNTTVVNGAWSIAAADLVNLVDGPLTFTASTVDIAGNTAVATTIVVKDTSSFVSIAAIDADQVLSATESSQAILAGEARNIEDGLPVVVTVTDTNGTRLTFTTTVLDGMWQIDNADLSSLVDGTLNLVAVTTDAQGNPAAATNTVQKDTQASITIEFVDNDDVINAAELHQVMVKGTVSQIENGQTVTIILTDGQGHSRTLTTTVINGAWTLTAQDLAGFNDGQLIATATVNDLAGNTATATTTDAVDILASITLSVDTGIDETLNRFEAKKAPIAGTVIDIENGQPVVVTVTDANGIPLTFNTLVVDGAWSIDAADVSSLADGTLSVTVSTMDVAGNPATSSTTILKDTLSAVSIEAVDNDGVFNLAEITHATLTGTAQNIESGQNALVRVVDSDGNQLNFVTQVIDGEWQLDNLDLSSLVDGILILVIVSTDAQGNPAVATNSVGKDTLANLSIEIVDNNGVINGTEMTAVVIRGTATNIENGRTVTVTLSDDNGHQKQLTTTINNGMWVLSPQDLSDFDDGSLTASVTASDAAGNSASASSATPVDTQAVISVHIIDGGDEVISDTEVNSVVIAGTTSQVEVGKTINVELIDAVGNRATFTTTVTANGSWSLAPQDLTALGLLDGPITANATVTDTAGNIASATDTSRIDTQISIDIDTGAGFNATLFIYEYQQTLTGTTEGVEAGQTVTLTLTDGSVVYTQETTVLADGTWTFTNIDVSTLDKHIGWQMYVSVNDIAGNNAIDAMPNIVQPDPAIMYEAALFTQDSIDIVVPFDIPDAALNLAADQERILGLTSSGQALRMEMSDDGQSFRLYRVGDNTLVLTATLVGTNLHISLLVPIDQGRNNIVNTYIKVEGLQTDADGTTESIITFAALQIRDAPQVAIDDSYTVIENTTSKGSITGNDFTIEGPLNVTKITFEGVDYPVTSGAPAIVNTGYGMLTVQSNGSWTFVADRNLDNTQAQGFSFDYVTTDRDGSPSRATVEFTIKDGAAAKVNNVSYTDAEPTYGTTSVQQHQFTVTAGSDALVANSVAFTGNNIAVANSLGFTSNGVALVFSLSADSKTLTATAGGQLVLSISISAVNNGNDLVGTAITSVFQPLDHNDDDIISLVTTITAIDTDGTPAATGQFTWKVADGTLPILSDISVINFDENNITATPQQGSFDVAIGSDQISAITFDAIKTQPALTSGGEAVSYSLSADGLTLTAYTTDITSPVFVAHLSTLWNATTNSTNVPFDITLYKALDQITGDEIDLKIITTDNDGDSVQSTIVMHVSDASPGTISDLTLVVSEQPNVAAYGTIASGYIMVSASADPIVAVLFNLIHGANVLDQSGDVISQNGGVLTWSLGVNGTVAEALNSSGQVVFRMSLPNSAHIDPGQNAQFKVDFELLGPIDHLGLADLLNSIDIGINAIDSDNTVITGELTVTIYDGKAPSLPTALVMTVNEADLVNNANISVSGNIDGIKGSDNIANAQLADGFVFGNYTSAQQVISLSATQDANGWYIATRTDSTEVFRIRFKRDGTVDYQQSVALDHPSGNGANNLDLLFTIEGIDADNDKSNSQTVTISVKDDVPESTTTQISFAEADNVSHVAQLFDAKEQGADGATVISFDYRGSTYLAGTTVTLLTDTNEVYGQLTITADGRATIVSQLFEYAAPFFSENINVLVRDADGDEVTDILSITASDAEGAITIGNTNFLEDTSGDLHLSATPGDVDEGELITSIVFSAASLNGGSLTLNGTLLVADGGGNIILTGAQLNIDPVTGVATPAGPLLYLPAEDLSDATADVVLSITVNITGKLPVVTEVPLTITSVADAPIWDNNSQFNYSGIEDGGALNLSLHASSKDEIGNDVQGSETVTYRISNIEAGLTLNLADGTTVTNGMVLTQSQINGLTANAAVNTAGEFTFDIQATSTENDNGDSANSSTETVTIDIAPVADDTTLSVRDIRSAEDASIALNQIITGSLTDTSGSEILTFELTLPDGWTLDAPSAQYLGNNLWTVSGTDVSSGAATLIPKADVSSANINGFDISVRSYSTESTQDGIDPINTGTNPNPNFSDPKTVHITLTGMANDVPTISSDPSLWTIDLSTGVISNVAVFNEDTDIPLDFTIVSTDEDGSENISLTITHLPNGANFVDSNGTIVLLPVVGFTADGAPIYSILPSELANLSLRPPLDFSGQIDLMIQAESTELDGDSATYNMTLSITVSPIVDETAISLQTISTGLEDRVTVLNLLPNLIQDTDGSESITGMTINSLPDGMVLGLDGARIDFPAGGLDLSTLLDSTSPTIMDLLSSGRLAVLPPEDADGTFTLDVTYTISDTSSTGQIVNQDIDVQLQIVVDAIVDVESNLQADQRVLVSADGTAIDLSDQIVFNEGDIDGSEVIDYIIINVPSGEGWYVSHPNGAINDGDGRWLIPTNGLTSDQIQEQGVDILSGVTIISEYATESVLITVEARILDRDDADVISTNFYVRFEQDAITSHATTVNNLQLTPIDGVEDSSISFGGHLNLAISSDPNDIVSFKVLASDLPHGGALSGSDVITVYDETGKNVIEYVFTTVSLNNLSLNGIDANFAGEFSIPITIIATDPLSGDTKIDNSQVIEIEVTPVVDGVTLSIINQVMQEDTPIALGLALQFIDTDTSPTMGGQESLVFGNSSQPIEIVLLDQGTLQDSSGLFQLKTGTTNTWVFTGSQAQFDAALADIEFIPPENLSGDFRLQINATVTDSAIINGSVMVDTRTTSTTTVITVNPVTDEADVPFTTVTTTGNEDALIDLSGVNAPTIDLIDTDGSEILSISIQGVPTNAVLYYTDSGGNLVALPNNGQDGGSFHGQPTYSWTVTQAQLASLSIKPPPNFNGDMPLTINVITQELGTADFETNTGNIIVGVVPVADGVQIITAPDAHFDSVEDEVILIDLLAENLDTTAHETMRLKVTITSDELSALYKLDGIRVGTTEGSFVSDGNGGYVAQIEVNAGLLTEFELLPGNWAFGELNVKVELSSIDSARVLGTNQTDTSTNQVAEFIVDIAPEVDPPEWLQVGDVYANDLNNVALNLEIAIPNPAPNESGYINIYGVPSGVTLSAGIFEGGKWVVDINDVAGLKLIGAVAGQTFELTLDPFATLNGDTTEGIAETITVTIDPAATALIAGIPISSGFYQGAEIGVLEPQRYNPRDHYGFEPIEPNEPRMNLHLTTQTFTSSLMTAMFSEQQVDSMLRAFVSQRHADVIVDVAQWGNFSALKVSQTVGNNTSQALDKPIVEADDRQTTLTIFDTNDANSFDPYSGFKLPTQVLDISQQAVSITPTESSIYDSLSRIEFGSWGEITEPSPWKDIGGKQHILPIIEPINVQGDQDIRPLSAQSEALGIKALTLVAEITSIDDANVIDELGAKIKHSLAQDTPPIYQGGADTLSALGSSTSDKLAQLDDDHALLSQ